MLVFCSSHSKLKGWLVLRKKLGEQMEACMEAAEDDDARKQCKDILAEAAVKARRAPLGASASRALGESHHGFAWCYSTSCRMIV